MKSIRKIYRFAKSRLSVHSNEMRQSPLYRIKPRGESRGRLLLSLGTQVYERMLNGKPLKTTHVAGWQNLAISRTFLDLGFVVDVMKWNDLAFTPDGPYDVLIDVTANISRLADVVGASCIKILHPMFAHWLIHNANTYSRYAGLLHRRGTVLSPIRILPPSASAEKADHIVLLGGPYSTGTYSTSKAQIHHVPQLHPFGIDAFLERDMDKCRRNFIWLGGRGCMHKGLDLTIEAFSDLPDCELYVCGQISNEPDFESVYRRELYELPNIHTVGWIDTMSQTWREIASRCSAIILPSASELSCTSVICAMLTGLIPVVTEETDMDLRQIGMQVEQVSVEGVKQAVCSFIDQNPNELLSLSRAAYDAAHERFGRKNFLLAYRQVICQILGIQPNEQWSPWDSDFRAHSIERILPATTKSRKNVCVSTSTPGVMHG